MKKSLALIVFLFFVGLGNQANATDQLFLHNGDSITLKNKQTTGDPVEFQIYSISTKSRIYYIGDGCGGTTITVNNSDGWVTKACSGGMVTINIVEKGTKDDDSDVVIRYDQNQVVASNIKGADNSKKGQKCSVCGKKLEW